MQTITIKAKEFFTMIKSRELSMWDMLKEMIDGEEKQIVFIDENEQIMMQYILPKNVEQLKADQKEFAQLFAKQLSQSN